MSYRVAVPPGWMLLAVRDKTDDELRDTILDRYRDLPRDSAGPIVSRLADAVVDAARRARDAGAVDIVLPLGTPWKAPVSASIAIAVGSDATDPDGEVVETEAGQAWRRSVAVSGEGMSARRRIEYTWRIPRSSDRLLVATATVVGAEDPRLEPIVDALSDLCEAIMVTIRWAEED